MSSDEEFDVDFVSNAVRNVKKKWQQIEETKDELKDVTNTNVFAEGEGIKRKKKKDSNDTSIVNKASDDDSADDGVSEKKEVAGGVTITPPGSPALNEKVRGAKASKKTVNALNKLQSRNQKLKVTKKFVGEDRDLDDLEDCRVVSASPRSSKFKLKICWKSNVERLEVSAADKVGKVTDEFAKKVGAKQGELYLYRKMHDGEPLARDQSLAELEVSFVTVLYARTKILTGNNEENNLIELKLRTQDRRAQVVVVKIKPTDAMETVMAKYSMDSGVDRARLRFLFDGEELEGEATAEDLELEGGECFDVHIK